MFFFNPFLASISRVYNLHPKTPFQFLLSKFLPSTIFFSSSLHHLCTFPQIPNPNSKIPHCNYSQSNRTTLLWYSSESYRSKKAYRKRVSKRLRLANKPVLDESRFNNAVSQLPARFTADDLQSVIAIEDDPLVCLELFNWASKQHRFDHNVNTFHITIQKLGLAGMMDEMYDVVDQLRARPRFGSEPLYNTVIYYFIRARKLSRAVTVFKHMKKVNNSDCKPSVKTYNLLFAAFVSHDEIDTCINHMYMDTMACLFRQLVEDGIEPDIFSLNSMIQGYVLSNCVNDALRIFHQMGGVYTCVPDAVTYDYIIHGLCAQARMNDARELFGDMKDKGFVPSARTYNSLVNALALGGELEDAVRYLWEMTEMRGQADLISYKTLLDEFCRGGRSAEALSLLEEFKEKRLVDDLTYTKLSHVIKDESGSSLE